MAFLCPVNKQLYVWRAIGLFPGRQVGQRFCVLDVLRQFLMKVGAADGGFRVAGNSNFAPH